MSCVKYAIFVCTLSVLFVSTGWGQNINAVISGSVTDPTGSRVPNAQLVLTRSETGITLHTATGSEGLYSFPNLQPGQYEIRVTAAGFRDFVQKGITVNINDLITVPVSLQLGAATQTIEVRANASPLNFESGVAKDTMSPTVIDSLPTLMQGGQRSALAFVSVLPGVNDGGSGATDGQGMLLMRINGQPSFGDEAVLDGTSMVEGLDGVSGITSLHADFPISPEAVDEISTLTQNYDVAFGATSGAVTTAVTKAGTNSFHGGAYDYTENTSLNARSYGSPTKPVVRLDDFGAFIGGPLKLPLLFWSNRKKTYIFINNEEVRSAGALNATFLSVPSAAFRQGDFSQWPNPIYDPDTTQVNPAYNPSLPTSASNLPYTRQQFMGCNGTTPNVICATDPRLADSLAQGWLKFLPMPTSTALSANYAAPISTTHTGVIQWDIRGDQYIGDRDHVMATWHFKGTFPSHQHELPPVIDYIGTRIPQWADSSHLNYDHTFGPNLLNHFAIGYLDLVSYEVNNSDCCVSQLPQIPGVASHQWASIMDFSEYTQLDRNDDGGGTRPAVVVNDLVTWVHGRHQFKFGGEFRRTALEDIINENASGTFHFSDLNTGLLGIPSGNSMASYLLGEVSSASVGFIPLPIVHPKATGYGMFAGDTWKLTSKLTIDPGIRWDIMPPSVEHNNKFSYFDPTKPNPGAGNLPGILAFAGVNGGPRHPEFTWYGAVAPRLSLAYALTPNTVARAGYGIFYSPNFYSGWGGGIGTDGFNLTQTFTSGEGGMEAPFLLQNGFPTNFVHPPFIESTYDNGENAPIYRQSGGNRKPYMQQWNLAVQHQFTHDFSGEAMYLGNKGTRLFSQLTGLNALNPSFLSMGSELYDTFTPGMTSLDGVNAPYPGWAAQMSACPPTVAQALSPYPQYCGPITPESENAGHSTYESLQLKAENRFARGFYLLGAYTLSKTLGDTDGANPIYNTGNSSGTDLGVSPFYRKNGKALALYDMPQVAVFSVIYELPFGAGKRFVDRGAVVNKLVGGWKPSGIIRLQSGMPFVFRSETQCNVPSQFMAGCIPAILSNPVIQKLNGGVDVSKPVFNAAAFQPASTFNFNFGDGPRISNIRGFGYHNVDFGLEKDTTITEKVTLEIRMAASNIFNLHTFTGSGSQVGYWSLPQAFNGDTSSPTFGMWNGNVTDPRNIQLGMKLVF